MAIGLFLLLISHIVLVSITCFCGAAEGKYSYDMVDELKEEFDLKPHAIGGYFRINYRWNSEVITADPILAQVRDLGSSVYFLYGNDDFSVWHKVKNQEIIYWQAGGTLKVHMIDPCGKLTTTRLCDKQEDSSCEYQQHKPPCNWLALEPSSLSDFAFIAIASFPGFDGRDLEMGKKDKLLEKFPEHEWIIKKLTR